MCEVGAISLGLQGAGMVSGVLADNSAKSSYEDYQAATTAAALANFQQQSNSMNNRYAEEEQASAMQAQQISIANMKAKATAEASAAGSGITGSTIETLFNGYDRATAVSNFTAAKNLQMKKLSYNDNLEGLRAQAISTINTEQRYTSTGASKLLSGAGGILSGYGNYQTQQLQNKFYAGRGSASL